MTYRTHLAAGYAAVLYTFSPDTLTELILSTGTAAIGSVISDVDASESHSRNNLAKVSAVTFLSIAGVLAADHFAGTDIASRFSSSASLVRLFTGFLIFLGVCIFGAHLPHRSFMHSIAGTIAVTFSFSLILPSAGPYMAVSMLSHIIIDMLNKKKVQLFFPLPKPRIGFGICSADGSINNLLFYVFIAAALFRLVITVKGFI